MISLKEFFLTGRLGELGPGSTRQNVLQALGKPPFFMGKNWKKSDIWCYGNIEFYFQMVEEEDHLFQIWCDRFPCCPEWPARQEIDPWIFDGNKTSRFKLLQGLNSLGYIIRSDHPWLDDDTDDKLDLLAKKSLCREVANSEVSLSSGVNLYLGYLQILDQPEELRTSARVVSFCHYWLNEIGEPDWLVPRLTQLEAIESPVANQPLYPPTLCVPADFSAD